MVNKRMEWNAMEKEEEMEQNQEWGQDRMVWHGSMLYEWNKVQLKRKWIKEKSKETKREEEKEEEREETVPLPPYITTFIITFCCCAYSHIYYHMTFP